MPVSKRLARYLVPYLPRFVQAGFCMAVVAALQAGIIWLIQPVMNNIISGSDVRKLGLVVAALPVMYGIKGIFGYAQNYLMNYISQGIVRDIRKQLFGHLQSLSVDFYHRNPTGQIMSVLTNDTQTLQSSIGSVPVQIIRDGLTVVFLVGMIFYLNWRFALVTMLLLPIAMIPIGVLGSKMRKAGRHIQVDMGHFYATMQEGITGNLITKIYGRHEEEIERFDKRNQSYYSLVMRWVRADALGAPIMEFLGSFAAGFLLWYGGRDVMNHVWTMGSFTTFLGASLSAYKPVKDFTSVNSRIQQGLACAERLFHLIDEEPSVTEKPGASALAPFRKEIHYQDVSFSYDNGEPVLKGVDLKIGAGQVVAFVGPSGSGKTTITHLLPRLFDVKGGAVLIDGTDIREVTLQSLRRQIGVVTQDTILFNETVRFNIAYGKSGVPFAEVPQSEIEEAAKVANAHDFILNMPQGYDTVIGERGVRLSGGQRQRLSIARAVLKNPPILILDEATSALDNESERLVQEALERLMKGRTVLVVAHRLSTVRKADRIVVLADGRIAGDGPHARLLDQSEIYRKLYETDLQAHGVIP